MPGGSIRLNSVGFTWPAKAGLTGGLPRPGNQQERAGSARVPQPIERIILVTVAVRGQSLLKRCNCDPEIVAPRRQRYCHGRIRDVGSIENPRPRFFGGNVALD
jgi:hypothetical protein